MDDLRDRLHAAVDGLEPTWTNPDAVRDHARGRRRRSRVGAGMVAIVLTVVATGFLVSGFVGGQSATGGRQVVLVDGLEALRDPKGVESRLRDLGIDVSIVDVPLPRNEGPDGEGYWEGTWWWATVDRPEQLTQREFEAFRAQLGLGGVFFDPENTKTLELPKIPGHITLFVGREVAKDEFHVFRFDRINELSPLGTFYCLGIDPDEPAALGEAIEQQGYTIKWTLETNNRGQVVEGPPPGTVATWAWLSSPGFVDMRISPAGDEARALQRAEGTYPADRQPPWERPC